MDAGIKHISYTGVVTDARLQPYICVYMCISPLRIYVCICVSLPCRCRNGCAAVEAVERPVDRPSSGRSRALLHIKRYRT